jgi:hypothetical protein
MFLANFAVKSLALSENLLSRPVEKNLNPKPCRLPSFDNPCDLTLLHQLRNTNDEFIESPLMGETHAAMRCSAHNPCSRL